jgi:tetratricopeptide (TPR) repeat protein
MLQLASVIGRTFSYRVLEDISGNGKVHDLESQIIVLQRAQLIRERARLPEREYIFKHVLTQEAAYNGLLKRERRAIHQRVADVLERLYPEHIEERLGLLAHHWEQAGDIDKTVEYLRRAGEQAAAQYANAEAVDYLSRALEMVPDTDMSIRYDLLLFREEIYFLQGRKELQAQDWPDLTALAEALDADDPLPGRSRSAEVGLRRIRIAIRTGKYNEAEEQALENLRLAQESTDKYAEAAAMREWGRVLFYRQNYTDSIQKLEQALSLARQADLREIEVDSSDTLGRAYMESGQVDKSLDLLSHELRVCQENGFRRREGIVFRDLAYAFSAQGDYTKALIYAEKSLQICREVGHRSDEGWALRAIGMIAIYQRPIDYVMIEHYMTQAIEIFSEMQDIHGLDWIYSVLHDIAEGQDDDTQVLCYAEEITDIFRQANYLRGVAVKFFKIGYFLLVRGQYTEAQSYLEQACRISEDIKSQEIQGWARIYTGRLYLALGDYNKAQMFSKESLAAARENDYSFLEYRCLGILSLIALAQGHYESANMYGQKTLTIAENIRNRFWQGQAKLILGHTLSGLGDWDAAEESYNQSIQLTKQIHFKFESAKTEAILDAKAGLTTMQLMRSDLSPPLSLAEEFLEHIKNQPRLPYTWQPMWIYLTCVQVLEANGDTRAQEVLEQAYNLIQERAATIEDEDLHRSYLENVPENREIVAMWEGRNKA